MKAITKILMVLAGIALSACASTSGKHTVSGSGRSIVDSSGKCYLGSSDPTLNGDNAIGMAAQAALKNLLVGLTPKEDRIAWVDLSENLDSVNRNDQMIISRLKKNMAGGRVVGWWMDRKGVGPRGRCDGRCKCSTAWAVACLEGYERDAKKVLPEAFRGPIPEWLKNVKASRKYICSIGFSGPTMNEPDAREYALENARQMVATSICGMGDHSFIDYMSGWGGTHDFPETRPSSGAIAYVKSVTGTEREKTDVWVDEKGVGPLGNPGTAYARVCVPRVELPCGNGR